MEMNGTIEGKAREIFSASVRPVMFNKVTLLISHSLYTCKTSKLLLSSYEFARDICFKVQNEIKNVRVSFHDYVLYKLFYVFIINMEVKYFSLINYGNVHKFTKIALRRYHCFSWNH